MGNENSKISEEIDAISQKQNENFDIIEDIASIQSLISDQSLAESDRQTDENSEPNGNPRLSRKNSASWMEKIKRYDELLIEMEKLKNKFEKVQADKVQLRDQIQKLKNSEEMEIQKSHDRLAGLLSEFKKVISS